MNLEAFQFLQGSNVVTQRVITGLGVEANMRSGFIQDMVAGENESPLSFIKADMSWRVPRRPYYLKFERTVGNGVAIL
jgi:hypothetical protein